MREVGKYLPNRVGYLSRFHAKRNRRVMSGKQYKHYLESNIEGIRG
jgi:hypothetical protein